MLIIHNPECQKILDEAGTKASVWFSIGYMAAKIDMLRKEKARLQGEEDRLFDLMMEELTEVKKKQ